MMGDRFYPWGIGHSHQDCYCCHHYLLHHTVSVNTPNALDMIQSAWYIHSIDHCCLQTTFKLKVLFTVLHMFITTAILNPYR